MANKKDVLNIRGITDARYANLVEAASKISMRASGRFKSASEVALELSSRFHISTGSTELDAILGGGMESCSLTEIYGEYRTGKSQLTMTLAVTAQLGSRPGKVIYVDTEGAFRPERLATICARFGVDHNTVLDNILFARVFTTDQQEEVPIQVEAKIDEDETPYSLLVIDSMMALWRTDFSGRGELSERQQRIGRHLNMLKKLAERHNLAVVYTNQVMSDPSGGMTYVSDPKKPVGGHVIAHAATTRLFFKKGRDNERVAKVVDSPNMPEAEGRFLITESGIADSE
ncbi:Meiotic recombination protein DMC1/LIM15 homolog [Durusdinium trenchii]|uniref:Meiotic recombination protein DMC1/LIM15 homolog n=1 Tax=Durusdinium trenchii TaxID=1381693 RepID=A0ABP0K4M3_9DINO